MNGAMRLLWKATTLAALGLVLIVNYQALFSPEAAPRRRVLRPVSLAAASHATTPAAQAAAAPQP